MIGNITDFRAYHTARGNSLPAGAVDADATAALTRGSDFIRRGFVLSVEETDARVTEAAYVAAGYEIGADGLAAMPGFWTAPETGKVLTKVGDVQWTMKDGSRRTSDAMSPHDVVARILRGAVSYSTGPLVA